MSGCLGVPSVSLWRHADQIPRWDHLGSAASRSSICLAKSWNGITVGGVVKNSPKDTPIELWGSPIPSGCYNPASRSLVHSFILLRRHPRSNVKKIRPCERAPEGAEEQPLRWTDEGRRSSGVTDDVITARMREHKEDSGDGRIVDLHRVGKRLQGVCNDCLHKAVPRLHMNAHLSYGLNTRCMRMGERIVNQPAPH